MDERCARNTPGPETDDAPRSPSIGLPDARHFCPEPLFHCDAEGRLVGLNRAAEELTGRRAHELVGCAFTALFPPEDRGRLGRAFARRHLRGVEGFRCEAPVLAADGRSHWVGMRVRRLDARGGQPGYACVAHDLEAEHAERESLRRRVRELAARAEEAAASAGPRYGFLAAMSDEIRAPMSGVIGMSRLLLETSLDGDQRMLAEVIKTSGEALLEIVDDLLDFSKIESGQLEVSGMDFDLRVAVEAVAAALVPAADGKGLSLRCRVHHRVPSRLNGDPGRLRQVLLSVGGNAVRLADHGEVDLFVDLVEETAHQVVLRFAVSEGGPSGAEEEAEALARCFARREATIPARHAGAGLGLVIARKLVSLMGGEAGVREEAAGRGRTYWFLLPLARAAEPAAPAPRPQLTLSGQRVLVADPLKRARVPLAQALRSWGCRVDEAEDGLAAIHLLREAVTSGEPHALVLVDLDLPVLGAQALAAAVRSNEALAGTQLVLFTGLGRPGDAARADDWGYAAYFVKPVPALQVHDALLEVVRRGWAPRAEHKPAEPAPQAAAPGAGLVTRYTVPEQRRRGVRVLVLGDSVASRVVPAAALIRMGYAPEIATGAHEAVARAAAQTFDLILIDVDESEPDARAIVEAIRRAEPDGRRTPIVAVTAEDDPRVRDIYAAAGVDGLLAKPLDLETMCATVERWTRGRSAAADGTEPLVPAPAEPAEAAPSASAAPLSASEPAPGEPAGARAGDSAGADIGDAPVLDAAELETSSMGSPALEFLLIQNFSATTQPPMERLRDAIEQGDAGAVAHEAERLARLSRALGAMRCAAVFDRIAGGTDEGNLQGARSLVGRAEVELKRIEAVLAQRAQAA